MTASKKIAVVLFNLGGPGSPEAVQPFLFNLFNDKAILGLPQPFRFLLAKLISSRRAPVAQEIYQQLGGKSPLLENTKSQAKALEKALSGTFKAKCFIAMRYWHPFSRETVAEVKAFAPDEIVLLPLYPQFSTTTTASSLEDWQKAARKSGLDKITSAVCCFPREKSFIRAHVDAIKPVLQKLTAKGPTRVLFTAHGLPEKIVAAGDPYAWQVEETVTGVVKGLKPAGGDWDHVVCYQSRVGPLKWLEPSTEHEIIRAGKDGRSLVVVPIAFVSEHSETLVELDIEYAALAKAHKIKQYERVPALGVQNYFIQALVNVVADALSHGGLMSQEGQRICPVKYGKCPCQGR